MKVIAILAINIYVSYALINVDNVPFVGRRETLG